MPTFYAAVSLAAIFVIGLLGPGIRAEDAIRSDSLGDAQLPIWCANADPGIPVPAWDTSVRANTIRRNLAALRGSGCSGFHHYCRALSQFYKGETAGDIANHGRSFYFNQALGNLDYTFQRSQGPGSRCLLLPEMYKLTGQVQTGLNHPREAEAAYRKAIEIKPGFSLAYSALSDLYESQGDYGKAIAVVREGIKANPRSSGLKKKLARLEARSTSQGPAP